MWMWHRVSSNSVKVSKKPGPGFLHLLDNTSWNVANGIHSASPLRLLLKRISLSTQYPQTSRTIWIRGSHSGSAHQEKKCLRFVCHRVVSTWATLISGNPYIYYFFLALNTEKSMKTLIDRPPHYVVYGGTVDCGIVTSHKHTVT